jgi:hypothetical protein
MTPALVGARLVVLALGVATTLLAVRAYRRQRTRYLRDASLGFGLMTVGVFLEGVLYQLVGLGLTEVHLVESLAIAAGFAVLLVSFVR